MALFFGWRFFWLDAYVADGNFRKRDPRFAERDRYQPKERQSRWFKADEFNYDEEKEENTCHP
ncbi:hypothetical protein [Pelagibaculum spongiae]|uniref:Uncharacterized protein n=1 Tax=Pelagibaculum spongiae TaxID=2080658 RepID=A0A2V1GQU4_9GAMM|nr:hypothetical protein [Pelagibaculum spongiae]PVZ66659.1 hypothetical protein DC094_15430 [Pelagibaculum spongiae]